MATPRKPRVKARPAPKPARSVSRELLAAFEPVREAAKGLPEIEEGTSYGTPALRVKGKFFTRIWEDGKTLVLRVDMDSQDSMLRLQPKIFYLTDHYRGYPCILIRLGVIGKKQLREVLFDSWRFVAPKTLAARFNQS
jgi:hypothetical protein